MRAQILLAAAGLSGLVAVALGAFGAHALKNRLPADLMAVFQTAVQYQFWHTLALFGVGLWALQKSSPWLNASGIAFALGVLVFSGSLYVLALTGVRAWGAVTPIGGVLFLTGWICVVVAALRG